MSPEFDLRTQVCKKINHYLLDQDTILPITAISGSDRRGGFGSVSKIKIHPAHRNKLSDGSESWLALKRLQYSTEQAFRAEVGPLKRLGKDHPHLIQLLATLQYGEDYYLLFNWADGGNLYDFFQSYPRADFPPRDPKLAKWLALQLSGLSDALASIHDCEPDPSAANMSSFNSGEIRKKYGTHGDLKPENILWFGKTDPVEENYTLGTFKLSDLGLTSFHGLESRKKFKPEGVSATYRAPEYDIHGRVSQQYDMWSLGCVLAELVTWYLLGGEAVTKFREERMKDIQPGCSKDVFEDGFFSVVDHPDYSPMGRGRAIAKISVREHFNMLRNLPGCTDFLLDLIDFVDEQLLRMTPKKRCQVSELLHFANSISEKCNEDSRYCLERIKPIKRRQETNLSELVSGPISHPMSRILTGSTNSSREVLLFKPDVRAAHQHVTLSDALDSKGRRPVAGPTKLNLEIRQYEEVRSVSPVEEVESPTPSQQHQGSDGQHREELSSVPKFSNPPNHGRDHCSSRNLFVTSNSPPQQAPKAQHLSVVSQTNATAKWASQASWEATSQAPYGDKSESSFQQGSYQTLTDLAGAVKRQTYNVGEECLGIRRIWAKLRRCLALERA